MGRRSQHSSDCREDLKLADHVAHRLRTSAWEWHKSLGLRLHPRSRVRAARPHVGDAGGGGLETEGGGTVTITDSTFDHNQAIGGSNIQGNSNNFIAGWGHGGAISNSSWTPTAGSPPGANPSTVIASDLIITNNQAIGGAGDTGPLAGLGNGRRLDNRYGGTFPLRNRTIAPHPATG